MSDTDNPDLLRRLKLHSWRPMKASIVREWKADLSCSKSCLIDYQPGNMTRYLVLFQQISPELGKPMEFDGAVTLVVFINTPLRPSIFIPDTMGYLSLNYFMEKTGIQEGDAAALVRLLRHKLRLQGN